MSKKIYKDPFALTLLSIVTIVYLYSQTAAGQSVTTLPYDLRYISGLSFTSLIVYLIIRPYLLRKQIKPAFGVAASLLIGFLVLIVFGFIAFGLAMSGG